MKKLKQNNSWLNSSGFRRSCYAIFMAYNMVSCFNIIREVEVTAYDVKTFEGVEGIELYTESGDTYITDENGKAYIKGGNLKGQSINTKLTLDGYAHAGYFEDCEIQNPFEIVSEHLLLPLHKNNYFKVTVFPDNLQETESLCVALPDRPCAFEGNTEFAQYFTLSSDGSLDSPRFSVGNTNTVSLPTNADSQRVKLFYNNDCSNTTGIPDSSFTVPINYGDTTNIVVFL